MGVRESPRRVEDQGRPLAVSRGSDRERPGATAGWLVSPAFDLLFLCNVGWVLALLPGYLADDGTPHVEFWQVYFVTTPHRWLTLLLVALDPDRREGRGRLFLSLALAAAAVVVGVYFCWGGFLCLMLVDYLWNGWHFASQHAGVLRVYSRKAGGGWPRLERHGLRLFVFYSIARTAGWTTGWLEGWPEGARPRRRRLDDAGTAGAAGQPRSRGPPAARGQAVLPRQCLRPLRIALVGVALRRPDVGSHPHHRRRPLPRDRVPRAGHALRLAAATGGFGGDLPHARQPLAGCPGRVRPSP